VNLAAALFGAGVWMIASALWQLAYRSPRADPEGTILTRLGVDVIPGVIVALLVARIF
jgi:hypothetical protein